MPPGEPRSIEAQILALPETAGSALYGMVDVLAAAGALWQELVGETPGTIRLSPRIVGLSDVPFLCGNGIPVAPASGFRAAPEAPILILPELWLGPHECILGRYPEIEAWICARHAAGAHVYAACSGTVLLAATGLLDGCQA
ncbi:MAG: hypothetical protein ACK4TG_09650, partial [Thermaurantiacus sp.]